MEENIEVTQNQSGTSAGESLSALMDFLANKPLDNTDPVWLAVIFIFVIVVATRRLTSSNVERERPIAGSHYKGKVTPGWMSCFRKKEALREEVNRTNLQEAIRAKRR